MGIKNHPVTLKNQGVHLAPVDASPAAVTLFGVMVGSKGAGHKFRWSWMGLDPGQNRAAGATAAAQDNHFFGIVGLKNEVGLVGHGEDLRDFRSINISSDTIANIIIGPFSEYHACFLGRIAAIACLLGLASADAGRNGELGMRLDQLLSTFIR